MTIIGSNKLNHFHSIDAHVHNVILLSQPILVLQYPLTYDSIHNPKISLLDIHKYTMLSRCML